MAWKQGPLPPKTWNWGGVVPKDADPKAGFFFADFCGDHVICCPDGRKLTADEVGWYDNGLELPPTGCQSRAQG